MDEQVDLGRFATLENDVKHQGEDIAEIKKNTESTSAAIQSISVSLATLTAHVEQNQRHGARIEKLEDKVNGTDKKIIAATSGATAIGVAIGYVMKVKDFF